jgi:hypothetical protein
MHSGLGRRLVKHRIRIITIAARSILVAIGLLGLITNSVNAVPAFMEQTGQTQRDQPSASPPHHAPRTLDQEPLDLYVKGGYAAAIAAGDARGDAEGLAIAARAALADANLRDAPCLSCLRYAEALARRAIAKDPSQTESHVYLAVALGYEARIVGVLRAQSAHYAEEAKQALDSSLATNPNEVWTLAALGGWNIEIVHSGGSLLAKMLYGATLDAGIDYYKRAFAADPGNVVVRFQYALSLSSVGLDAQRHEIAAALKEAAECRPQIAYESAIKLRAGKLLDLLARDRKAYLALVAQYQGYP